MMFNRVRAIWQSWRSRRNATRRDEEPRPARGDQHLELARESLRELARDRRIPDAVRTTLAEDYAGVERMLAKLEHGHVHIAAFGRVGVGKSSLLNALLGKEQFRTSPLHGETQHTALAHWEELDAGGVYLIDTPGIDEVAGEDREQMAREAVSRVDLVLFVVEADLTALEHETLKDLACAGRPTVLVLNKADRYTAEERDELLRALQRRCADLIDGRNILTASARETARTYLIVDEHGSEIEETRRFPPDVTALKTRLWQILESEGKTLVALNAGLFASDLSDQVAKRILEIRHELGEKVVRTYCVAKGVVVALNPVPVTDLFAAAFVDLSMVLHLSRVHGLPLTRAEAGTLIKTVVTQLAALMGTVWALHVASSALKLGTGGLSTVVTAGAQGAVAYYSTYLVGRVAERYLANGKSWGEGGPKRIVDEILDDIDRNSILAEAREEIRGRLRSS